MKIEKYPSRPHLPRFPSYLCRPPSKPLLLVMTTVRLWCPVQVQLVSLAVTTSSADHPSIGNCVLSISTLPSLPDKGCHQRQPSLSTPLIVCTLHHAQCKTQVVITIVLFVSLHTVLVDVLRHRQSAINRWLRFVELYASLRSVTRVSAGLRFPLRFITIQDTCPDYRRPLQAKVFSGRCRQQTATAVDRFFGNAPAAPHRQQSTPPAQFNCSAEQDFYQQLCQTTWGKSSDVFPAPL